MTLVVLLGSELVKNLVSWDKLRTSFFEKYCLVVLRWCGYDEVKPLGGRLNMYNQEFMVVFFGEMKQSGMLNDAMTYEELAEFLHLTFHSTWEATTICHKLKILNHYSDYTPVIQQFISEIRKVNKGE